jgi:hypothetical protein
MSLLTEIKQYGLADCAYNRQFFTTKQKYSAYCYWAAKQGIKALSFNAWRCTVKNGRLF